MSKQRFGLLLIATLVVLACAFFAISRRDLPRETLTIALLPSLPKDLESLTAVTVRKSGAQPTVILHKIGDRWTVAQRADYPADVAKLRTLLVAMRDAKIVEEKTADPARFATIGVEDPGTPGASGTEITVASPAGSLAVIVGKPVAEGNFARRGGENRTYAVEPGISVETEPRYWIDARLLDVQAALIQRIEMKPAGGIPYTLRRLNPADDFFGLDGVPAGRQALDGHALAPAPSTLTALNAEDVSSAADVDFSGASQITLTLTDGNVVTLTGTTVADKHWVQAKATKDPILTAKATGRAFEIASYRYDAIFKPLDQLLIPKPAPAAGKPGSEVKPVAPAKPGSAGKAGPTARGPTAQAPPPPSAPAAAAPPTADPAHGANER